MLLHRPRKVSETSIAQLAHNDQQLLKGMWVTGDIKVSYKTANHNGWLLCDGATYNQQDYPQLYDMLGGVGGTFTVPTIAAVSSRNSFIHA